ncbi:MAG: ATP-binding protein [Pyrinomonadaceae bacterium]
MSDFTPEDTFPHSLLNEPIEERLKYFQEYSVAHPIIESSFNKLRQTILFPSGKQLVFVIGPPGSGKTFLRRWIEDEVKSYWEPQQHTDPGRIPVAWIEVPAKDRLKPSVGDIYLRLLRSLEEPLIDKKIVYGDVTFYQTDDNQIRIGTHTTIFKLRYALEKCCEHRKPFFLAFDEAQHLMNLAGMSIEELMDWLKSLANLSKVLICLYGTYEMYDLLDLSDQLMRRSKIIHLRRYANTGEDLINFRNTILSFQNNLPFEKQFDLMSHSDYLYERTAGCVGNLYDWLLSAVNIALLKSGSLKYRHLRETVPFTFLQASKMNESIQEDEDSFFEKIGKDDEIEDEDNKTDNEDGQSIKSRGQNRSHSNNLGNKTKSSKSKSQKKPRYSVGKRNPTRDPIGTVS